MAEKRDEKLKENLLIKSESEQHKDDKLDLSKAETPPDKGIGTLAKVGKPLIKGAQKRSWDAPLFQEILYSLNFKI